MMVFPVRIEHALNVSVQCSHDADPGEHRRATGFSDQDQDLHRGLPFGGGVLGLRRLGDLVAGILERDEPASAGKRDWIVEGAAPFFVRHTLQPIANRAGCRRPSGRKLRR